MSSLWFILNQESQPEDVWKPPPTDFSNFNNDILFQAHQQQKQSTPLISLPPPSPFASLIEASTQQAAAELKHAAEIKAAEQKQIAIRPSSSSSYTCPSSKSSVVPYYKPYTTPTKKSIRRESLKRTLTVKPELMKMKQGSAAIHLGIPASTFSKRWRESLPDRKWPFRTHMKIEKSIKMLLILQKKGHDVSADMEHLLIQQEENLRPAVIELYEDPVDGVKKEEEDHDSD
eukprot:TRINITY_DN4214_c0_g2_i1.p1 TRINITY_DN4214_c0_g2~~TRINITY_DN4214_c0_g2_i1.p1  ORF type:complete len:231 (+),score=63.20 TRINITY_DN4214_c0_g2_i1:142-834(+)